MDYKFCTKCDGRKHVSLFNKNKNTSDGLSCHCKECVSDYGRNNSSAKRQKEYRLRNAGKVRKNNKEYRDKNKDKITAQNALSVVIQAGIIFKPEICSWCGSCEKRIEAHHEDYSKFYHIKWLCRKCHRNLHFGNNKESNEMRANIKIPENSKNANGKVKCKSVLHEQVSLDYIHWINSELKRIEDSDNIVYI